MTVGLPWRLLWPYRVQEKGPMFVRFFKHLLSLHTLPSYLFFNSWDNLDGRLPGHSAVIKGNAGNVWRVCVELLFSSFTVGLM